LVVLLQQIFNGLMLGSTYAIVALGLTLVYGILHVPNFAHGHLYMLGAYICFTLISVCSMGFWPAVVLSALVLGVIGLAIERLAFRPLNKGPEINSLLAAIGVMMILENGVITLWGPQGKRIPNPYPGMIDFHGIILSEQRLLVIVAAFVLIFVLQAFIKKTLLGSTIEAVAQDREGAALVGINVKRVSALTFAISAFLASIAACLVAPIFIISPDMGAALGMKAFVIVILGGLGSVPGAIAGGILLGMIEALGGGYLSAAYKDVYAFGAMVLILAVRPMGLFGKEVQGR